MQPPHLGYRALKRTQADEWPLLVERCFIHTTLVVQEHAAIDEEAHACYDGPGNQVTRQQTYARQPLPLPDQQLHMDEVLRDPEEGEFRAYPSTLAMGGIGWPIRP